MLTDRGNGTATKIIIRKGTADKNGEKFATELHPREIYTRKPPTKLQSGFREVPDLTLF